MLLVTITILIIIFLTFNSYDLPAPLNEHFHVSPYYYYSIPISLIIALIFLNYFAMTFGTQFRLRKDALAKMEEVMAKEHELLSLGGQAAAAAHSLGTPLSTIKIITHELTKQFNNTCLNTFFDQIGKVQHLSFMTFKTASKTSFLVISGFMSTL